MSKHNYTQYSNKKNRIDTDTLPVQSFKMEVEPAVLMEETVDTVVLPEKIKGFVVGCSRLNVRETPSADGSIVCVLDAGTEMEIDAAESTSEWLKICIAMGIEGYCMRKYVDANL